MKKNFSFPGLNSPGKKNKKISSSSLFHDLDKVQSDKSSWLNLIKTRLRLSRLAGHGGSSLSRAERRKIFWQKLSKGFVTVILIIVVLTVIKEPLKDGIISIQIFQIKEIVISGCQMTNQAEMKKLANIDYTTSIFSVNLMEIEQLLLHHPWIKKAEVKKQWPNGIHIQLVEYRANAMIASGKNDEITFFYINRYGKSIAPVGVGQNIDYPVITGVDDLEEVKRQAGLKDAVEFLKEVSRNDPNLPAQSVSEIHLDREEGMVIHLVEHPFPIYFGSGEVKKKYKQLRKVLAVLYKKRNRNMDIKKVEYIRVDYLENKVLIARTESG